MGAALIIRKALTALALFVAATSLTACEASKSSNPLSPTVAGPIPGVDISAPKILEPPSGTKIAIDKQPVTLLIENPWTTGARPLTLVVEIATDAAFTTKVFSLENLAPGEGGRTSVRLPDPLASGRTYFWRARAQDGANTGPYSGAAEFNVYTPIIIDAPTPTSPAANATVDGLRPRFVVTNAPRSGPVGPISYLIEVADSDAFTNRVAVWTAAEQSSQTTFEMSNDLAYSKVYYWHVRAYDATTTGPFSRNQAFATPAAPVIVTPTPTPGGGGGSPAPGDAINLAGATIVKGPAVANWAATSTVTQAYATGGQLCIYHSQLGHWPTAPFFGDPGVPVEGNQWIFIQRNGQWYGGANDWYRPGQACKGVDSNIGRDGFSEEPLHSWVPQSGETFGVMASTPARLWPDMATIDQRSNVVLIKWQ